MAESKIIVVDDDPTGSQTVHSCLLLTRWDVDTLAEACLDSSPLFFVLSNTRGMNADRAASVTSEICRNLKQALDRLEAEGRPINPIVVSRSDSTLRGHYPVETDIMSQELGPFDAHFLVPAFFEGGRITRNSIHYLKVDGKDVPVHETEFARDSVFGYHHSYLPDYVEEKTGGRIRAGDVERFLLEEVRSSSLDRLLTLEGNRCCAVDSESQKDLNRFADDLNEAASLGKRFLFRSAASLLTALAKLPPQPVKPEEMFQMVRGGKPGAVIVGSHVQKTTQQLNELLKKTGIFPVEIDVQRIADKDENILTEISEKAESAFAEGKTSVIYTSRKELVFDNQEIRLKFGESVSSLLMDVVRRLPQDIGFLISKGGITSNDVLSTGLALRKSRVLGQILTGCSVVQCPSSHARYPDLPVVIFPGNVGDNTALATVYSRLAGLDR